VIAKVVFTISSLSTLSITSSLPFISSAYAEENFNVVRQFLFRNVRFGMTSVGILGAFFAVFGEGIINVWLGKGNFVGYDIVWVMLVMIVLEVHHVIVASVTMATGKIAFYWIALLAGVLNIGLSIALGLHLGLFGIALGTTITQILTNNWYVPLISLRHLRISFLSYTRNVIIPVMAFLLMVIGSDVGVRAVLSDLRFSQDASLVIGFVTCGVIGIFTSFFVVLRGAERKMIITKLRGMRNSTTSHINN
jgi:O-antigen/teichoic acid export membrane protein